MNVAPSRPPLNVHTGALSRDWRYAGLLGAVTPMADGARLATATCSCLRRRVLALRFDWLPEAERRALVVDALGDQPVRLALGLVRVAAGRPDPLHRGRDGVDPVRQLHLG